MHEPPHAEMHPRQSGQLIGVEHVGTHARHTPKHISPLLELQLGHSLSHPHDLGSYAIAGVIAAVINIAITNTAPIATILPLLFPFYFIFSISPPKFFESLYSAAYRRSLNDSIVQTPNKTTENVRFLANNIKKP